jgi:hypothetical protein
MVLTILSFTNTGLSKEEIVEFNGLTEEEWVLFL